MRFRSIALGVALFLTSAVLLAKLAPIHRPSSDFRTVYYIAGRAVLDGHFMYRTPTAHNFAFIYPPFAALFIAPFSLGSASDGGAAWYIAQVVAMVIAAMALSARITTGYRRTPVAGLIFLAFVSFSPTTYSSGLGQLDPWILAAIVGAFTLASGDKGPRPGSLVLAGLLLGLAATVKIYPLLMVAIIVIIRRKDALTLLLGVAMGVAIGVILPIVVLGPHVVAAYWHVEGALEGPQLAAFPYSFGLLGIAYRGMTSTPFARPLFHIPPHAVEALVIGATALVLVYGVNRLRQSTSVSAIWSGALLLTVVCIPFLELQHLTILAAIPAMLAIDGMLDWRSAAVIMAASATSTVLSLGVSGHPGQVLSFTVAFVAGAIIALDRSEARLRWALFTIGYVLTGAPGIANFASQWGVPISTAHVVLGAAEYGVLLLLALPLPFGSPQPKLRSVPEIHTTQHRRSVVNRTI